MKQVNLLHNNYNRIGPYVTFQNKHMSNMASKFHSISIVVKEITSNRNISKQINFINCFHSSRQKSQLWYPYCRIIVSVAVSVRHTVSQTESCTFAFKLQRFRLCLSDHILVQRNPEKACVGVIMNFYGWFVILDHSWLRIRRMPAWHPWGIFLEAKSKMATGDYVLRNIFASKPIKTPFSCLPPCFQGQWIKWW